VPRDGKARTMAAASGVAYIKARCINPRVVDARFGTLCCIDTKRRLHSHGIRGARPTAFL
jgi:hypothetical protein